MVELSLLCPQDRVEVLSDALDALDALSVSVEDADAQTDAERALFGEPGMPPPANPPGHAGAANNSQGLRGTPVGMLRDWFALLGERGADGEFVAPRYLSDANHPERRSAANQRIATYMRRQVQDEEAFLVDPERWALVELGTEKADTWFVDGLEAGYVFEDTPRFSSKLGTYSLATKWR